MSVHFNPNATTDTSRISPVMAPSARSYNTAFCGSSTLSSLAQQGGENEDQPAPTVASKDDADRGFCGTLCYVLTAPFRAVIYIATSAWDCLFGRKEAAAEVDAEAAKPAKRTSEFDQALKAKEIDSEDLENAYRRLPTNHRTRVDDLVWVLSGKGTLRKEFERTMHDLSDDDCKALKQLRDAQDRLGKFAPTVRAQKIKELPDEEQDSARNKAMKAYNKLSTGAQDKTGAVAQGRLVAAALILRGVVPGEGAELNAQEKKALGDFDAPVKEAIERLTKFNMMLLPSQKARDSISEFVKGVSGDRTVNADRIQQLFKDLDPDAARLLNLAVSHAKDLPKSKNLVSECVQADAQMVLHIATLISKHDNGEVHSGLSDERGGGNYYTGFPPGRGNGQGFDSSLNQ